jgi:hypothetical protein
MQKSSHARESKPGGVHITAAGYDILGSKIREQLLALMK